MRLNGTHMDQTEEVAEPKIAFSNMVRLEAGKLGKAVVRSKVWQIEFAGVLSGGVTVLLLPKALGITRIPMFLNFNARILMI